MIDDRGTAVPTHQYIKLGNGVFILEPICCCHFAEPDTGCAIYCPLHGKMYKRNGIIEPRNDVYGS